MAMKTGDIIIGAKTEEAEERYIAEAKQVEAPDFHPGRVGSSPISDTKEDMNCNWNIKTKTEVIDGRAFSRLSVLHL